MTRTAPRQGVENAPGPSASMFQNITALYAVQFANYLLPLITIPFLARVLRPAGLGSLGFALAFSAYATVIIEYGFSLSGTREVARNRARPEVLGHLVPDVFVAKAMLAACVVLAMLLGLRWIPIFRQNPALLVGSCLWAVAQGFHPGWFFQGMERMRTMAVFDVGAKVIGTAGILLTVRTTADGWKVLFIQAAAAMVSTSGAVVMAHRAIPFRRPTVRSAVSALRFGSSLFLFKGAASLYTVGNAFVLGLLAPAQYVGYYSGSEKIVRGFLSLLAPVGQAFYARVSNLVVGSPRDAARMARRGLILMVGGGALLSVAIFLGAHLLVEIILGPGYTEAVPALRVLSLLPALVALNTVLGLQWMVPLGMDRAINLIAIGAGLINVALAIALAHALHHVGMALAVVTAELAVALAIFYVLRVRGLHPLALDMQKVATPAAETLAN